MRTTKHKSTGGLIQAVAVAALVMAAGVAGNVAGTYVHSAPLVGHIVAFQASATIGSDADTSVAVHRQDQSDCGIELNVIHRFGGSLVVETQIGATGMFRVHWAGPRTSNDSEDCGSDADLMVGRHELDILASSAGGYGAGQERAPALASSIGQAFTRMLHNIRPEN